MNRVFAIFLFVPALFSMLLFVFYVKLCNYEEQSLQEYRLKKAVNYCIDAATAEMLEVEDLGMDYADWGKLNVDPSIAVDEFASTFCLNYDLQPTKENKELVELAYTKLFVVCAYDGYYVYTPQEIGEDGSWQLIGTPKLPYSYKQGGNTYALNLGLKNSWVFTSTNKLAKVNSPLSEKNTLMEINKRLSDDLAYRIDKQYENGWEKTLYIPYSMTTLSATNPINRPSVLAFLDDIDIITARDVSAFGVGGARVTQSRPIAAYRRNSEDYYCYSDLLPADLFSATNADGTKTFIENMYTTCQEAADAGYHHDPLYMN